MFFENELAAIDSPANFEVAARIINNEITRNTSSNQNRPQLNFGPSGADTLRIVGNQIIGDRNAIKAGGIAISNLLGGELNSIVQGNTVKDNRYGIAVLGSANVDFIDNVIENNDSQGNPNSGGEGISVELGGIQNVNIIGNEIRNNLWGVALWEEPSVNMGDSETNQGGNIFSENGHDGNIIALYNNTAKEVQAKYNCWIEGQESTQEEVEDVIFHQTDDNSLGEVFFNPFLCGTNNEDPCTWTVIVQDPSHFGNEVQWELRGSDGEILLSGGEYGGDYYDEQSIEADGPVEFYISAIGNTNDNKPAYTVSNDNGVILTGVLLGGNEITYPDLYCSTPAYVENYSCEDHSMTSENSEVAYEIGGSDLHNRLAIDIPVNDDGLTLYGIQVNFFVNYHAGVEFEFNILNDTDGKPNEIIAQTTSQVLEATLVGNQFGRDLYELKFKFTDVINLDPNRRYWLELVTPEGAWQAVDFTPVGKGVTYHNDYTNGEWVTDPTSEFIYTLLCDQPLEVPLSEKAPFSFYPNPVRDILTIQSEDSIASVSIIDMAGREIMELKFENGKNEQLNLTGLSSGVYLVKAVFSDNRIETFKIIKDR